MPAGQVGKQRCMATRFERDTGETAGTDLRDRPTADLVKELSSQVSTLVRQEMELAKAELSQKGKQAGIGGGMLGGGGVLALYGLGLTLATAVLALQLFMADWLAALIVAVVTFAAAGVLALMGKNRVKRAVPPAPKQAIDSTKETVDTTKHAVQEARR